MGSDLRLNSSSGNRQRPEQRNRAVVRPQKRIGVQNGASMMRLSLACMGAARALRRAGLSRRAARAPLVPTPATGAAPRTQSKKRGLSLEEKRDKVLEVFHESADVFVLKVRSSFRSSIDATMCASAHAARAAAVRPPRRGARHMTAARAAAWCCAAAAAPQAGQWHPPRRARACAPLGSARRARLACACTLAAAAPMPTSPYGPCKQDIEKIASKRGVVLQSVKEVGRIAARAMRARRPGRRAHPTPPSPPHTHTHLHAQTHTHTRRCCRGLWTTTSCTRSASGRQTTFGGPPRGRK